MYLNGLKLINFRNYKELEIIFDKGFNFLVGNNAQGKTNLVEAIYFLSAGKSYRTSMDTELVGWGSSALYIKGNMEKNKGSKAIEIGIRGNNKKVKVNGVELNKRGELLGNLTTVIFSPDELKLVKEGPSYRRRFMDQEIIQIKPSYYYVLNSYNKVLFQRNSLLRDALPGKVNDDTLAVWDKQLVGYGARLIFNRIQFIERLSTIARLMHRKITNGEEELEIHYLSCIDINGDKSLSDIHRELNISLERNRNKDIKTGVTNFGPHREDLSVNINGIDTRKFGSQGQQRTAALSMKLSEIELMKSETGEYPILLLDDVMSELDKSRQKYILENLAQVQTFITCTHLSEVMEKRYTQGKVFYVNSGIISSED